MNKWIYAFSASFVEGSKEQRDLLGGKGANLAEMCSLELPVPPGMTITTQACLEFLNRGGRLWDELRLELKAALQKMEKNVGKELGHAYNPLLLSVRSGARVSMPGMMDTVLNLGLNDKTVMALAKVTKNETFAWDSYRRFIQMYGNVVLEVPASFFEELLEDLKEARSVQNDSELTVEDLQDLVVAYKDLIRAEKGVEFPTDPWEQLEMAIMAVFNSWNNDRAIRYRNHHGYSHDWGTAVNIQTMVFGNKGETSGTGVAFTRDPSTGEKKLFGEYLLNAQGEDVVSGIRTPAPINEESRKEGNKEKTLEETFPVIYKEFVSLSEKLEKHYRDVQDIEFTIETGKLYLLQTRNAKRTAKAKIKCAIDLVSEGLLSKEEALMRVGPDDLNTLLHPQIKQETKRPELSKGLPASPGAAIGKICFSSSKAEEVVKLGERVILVRNETSPDDVGGMMVSEGILTARGGMTSHAAVVARGMGRPCIVGAQSLIIEMDKKILSLNGKKLKEGDVITIDGGSGEIFDGEMELEEAEFSTDFKVFMEWADEFRTKKVRANADTPRDAIQAKDFGAEGIGLCRTEHMFFDPERVLAVREMIFADDDLARGKALEKILPFQEQDFYEILKVNEGLPVNIRLLDPPLHEFLPYRKDEKEELAEHLGVSVKRVEEKIHFLHEMNPMLGHRGIRLGMTYPEIYSVQAKAILMAGKRLEAEGVKTKIEIMIPLIISGEELQFMRKKIETVADELGISYSYKIGTMIETPRAALVAKDVALHADFFSFGTNDLTQTTLAVSRDDSGKFLPDYVGKGILEADPFVSLDVQGVGFLIHKAIEDGRKSNPKMHIGICGEHGGDPKSIEFLAKQNLDYVSCSPFRVPLARLALAQEAVKELNERAL